MFGFLNPDAKFYDHGFKNCVNFFKEKGFPYWPLKVTGNSTIIGCHRRATVYSVYQSFPCRLL
jgi:hypothetical protein